MSYNPNQGSTYNLGASIGSTDTSILLSSFLEPVSGTPLTMSYLNTSIAFGTIGPVTSSSELISFTGITQNANGTATLTGVTRGLQKAYPYTTSVTFQLPHAGQSIFILSDAPQVFAEYPAKNNNEDIVGLWNFEQTPTGLNPGAVPDASTTTKGITKMSVAPVSSTSPIAVGDNDPRIPTSGETAALVGNNTDIAVGTGNKFVTQTGLQKSVEQYAVSTGSANAYIVALSPIPTSYAAGMPVKFTSNFANTGSATVNVNSLGAKTIKKLDGATNLVSGDIANGQTVTLIYDGTNFVMQNPPVNTYTYVSAVTTTGSITTTQNIDTAFTTGFTPKIIQVYFSIGGVNSGPTNIQNIGTGIFNGATIVNTVSMLGTTPIYTQANPTAGTTPGSTVGIVTLSITSLTSTGFTVHLVFNINNSQACNATFNVVAFG